MYLGRLGYGPSVSLPPPEIPVGGTISQAPKYYQASQSSLAVVARQSTERTYDAAVIAATRNIPVAGGGLDVTRRVGDASPFAPGARGGSGRAGGSQSTYTTEEDLVEAESAQAIDEASAAGSADTLTISDSIPGLAQAQGFFSKYKTPILIGGVILGGLVIWKILR
jgi:hypothetical protein